MFLSILIITVKSLPFLRSIHQGLPRSGEKACPLGGLSDGF